MPSPTASTSLAAPPALVLQLLEWLGSRARTYRETIEAWRTSCPRLPVWEDVTMNGFVVIVAGEDGEELVQLTDEGRAFLNLDRISRDHPATSLDD
jgi:D-3-phosphoglycerate dehydrogenase